MSIQELYRFFLNEVSQIYSKDESSNITNIIFEEFAGIGRSDVIKNPSNLLPEATQSMLQQCLSRLMNHEPVQYITGYEWFYKLKFKVSPAVLIPRPETEELVLEAITFLKERKIANVLDIGTGSGCIPIAIKKNLPHISVTSIDVSNEALEIAKKNATTNDATVIFKQANFLSENIWSQFEQFDVIISNPPYIPQAEQKVMDKNVVKYEPSVALFVNDDNPFVFYKKIAAFSKKHLKIDGKVFMETHEDFAAEVCDLFLKEDYEATIKKDMYGKDRIVVANLIR